jgi:hypothetical protein
VFRQDSFINVLPGGKRMPIIPRVEPPLPFMHERHHALGVNAHFAQLDVLIGCVWSENFADESTVHFA